MEGYENEESRGSSRMPAAAGEKLVEKLRTGAEQLLKTEDLGCVSFVC